MHHVLYPSSLHLYPFSLASAWGAACRRDSANTCCFGHLTWTGTAARPPHTRRSECPSPHFLAWNPWNPYSQGFCEAKECRARSCRGVWVWQVLEGRGLAVQHTECGWGAKDAGMICSLLSKQTLPRSQGQRKEYPLLPAFNFGSVREKARLDWAQTGI